MNAWQIIDWINAEIKKRGWTPIEAAQKLGVSVSCIRYMQHKQGMLRLDSLCLILDVLGYQVAIEKKEQNHV